jgi:hypothetical protein
MTTASWPEWYGLDERWLAHRSDDEQGRAGAGMKMTGMDMKATEESKQTAFDPTQLMWMPKMGWMNMSQCHHCSMPLPGSGEDTASAWQASTVSAEGWTMRVRCALCARDMSAEVKGGAILSLATENPLKRVVVFPTLRAT